MLLFIWSGVGLVCWTLVSWALLYLIFVAIYSLVLLVFQSWAVWEGQRVPLPSEKFRQMLSNGLAQNYITLID